MTVSIIQSLLFAFYLLSPALGSLDIVNEWDGGFQAKLNVPIVEATNGWRIELEFEKNVEAIEVSLKKNSVRGM